MNIVINGTPPLKSPLTSVLLLSKIPLYTDKIQLDEIRQLGTPLHIKNVLILRVESV